MYRQLPLWIASRLDALRWAWDTLQQSHVSLSSVLATCLAWVGLVFLDLWRRRRWPHASDEAELGAEMGELGMGDETQAEGSSEEKKLAFACLSEAIEEVKTSITDQQYLALYSAALWTFNLTPCWAEGRPVPPDRRDVGAAASGAASADTASGAASAVVASGAASAVVAAAGAAESSSSAAEAAPGAEPLQPAPGPSEPLQTPPGPSDGPKRRRARARRTEQPAAEEELVFATTW